MYSKQIVFNEPIKKITMEVGNKTYILEGVLMAEATIIEDMSPLALYDGPPPLPCVNLEVNGIKERHTMLIKEEATSSTIGNSYPTPSTNCQEQLKVMARKAFEEHYGRTYDSYSFDCFESVFDNAWEMISPRYFYISRTPKEIADVLTNFWQLEEGCN